MMHHRAGGRVRFIALVLKTRERDERSGGSNPSLSARIIAGVVQW